MLSVPSAYLHPLIAEDIPQVGHDCDESCDCATWFQVLCDESAPAVLVLVLVEIVLAVSAITINLCKTCRFKLMIVRNEHTVVPIPANFVLDEVKFQLHERERIFLRTPPSSRLPFRCNALGVFRWPAEKNAATPPISTIKLEHILFRFPAGTAINPTMIMFYLFEQ